MTDDEKCYEYHSFILEFGLWDKFYKEVSYGIMVKNWVDKEDMPYRLPPSIKDTMENQVEWNRLVDLCLGVKAMIEDGKKQLKEKYNIV